MLTDLSYFFSNILDKSGVYILSNVNISDKPKGLLYVGKSQNIGTRIVTHYGGAITSGSGNRLSHALKEAFDKVQFHEEQDLFEQSVLEEFYILKFNPPLNKRKSHFIYNSNTAEDVIKNMIRRDFHRRPTWNHIDIEAYILERRI